MKKCWEKNKYDKKGFVVWRGVYRLWKPKYASDEWEEGPVQPIIRKSINVDIIFEYATREDVKEKRLQRARGLKGHGRKAYALCLIARSMDIDHIICYVDADRSTSSSKSAADARKRFREVYEEIRSGFQQFSAERSATSIPMIPLKMIESWLLADETAFATCFGNTPTNPALPSKPELIWGDENVPASKHPKNYIKRVLDQYQGSSANRETFKDIAENMDINILRARCPLSFERFYQDVQVID